jgi:acetyl-CoA carboxylase biotin carboxyl carrier protein
MGEPSSWSWCSPGQACDSHDAIVTHDSRAFQAQPLPAVSDTGDAGTGAMKPANRGGSRDPDRSPRRRKADGGMTPQEMKQLAELLQNVPGIRSIELKDVKGLAQLLREAPEIGSIEIKGWFGTGVVITRTSATPSYAMALPVPAVAQAAVAAEPEAAAAPRAVPAPPLKEIKSPMVGTWYKSPEPGADPYVKVGSRVTAGQTVCIIEAMKIMNEIEAEITGVIREVCVEDAQPVEFGQVLFRVDPNG